MDGKNDSCLELVGTYWPTGRGLKLIGRELPHQDLRPGRRAAIPVDAASACLYGGRDGYDRNPTDLIHGVGVCQPVGGHRAPTGTRPEVEERPRLIGDTSGLPLCEGAVGRRLDGPGVSSDTGHSTSHSSHNRGPSDLGKSGKLSHGPRIWRLLVGLGVVGVLVPDWLPLGVDALAVGETVDVQGGDTPQCLLPVRRGIDTYDDRYPVIGHRAGVVV